MNAQIKRNDGLEVVYRNYATYVDNHAVVVEGVPYLHDPETDEYFLEPATMQGLFNMIHSPATRPNFGQSIVHRWAGEEAEQPQLSMRFIGKGYEYGYTPVSLFARASDRVRETVTSLRNEVFKLHDFDFKKLSPFTTEPRVASVAPGSLIFNLRAPEEGLFVEETEQVLVKESLEVLVDAASWVASGEESAIPETLAEPKLRAVALRTVERLLPSGKDTDAIVELGGDIVKASTSSAEKVMLTSEMRPVARERFTKALAEFQTGEAVTLTGTIETLGRKGRIGTVTIANLSWEVKKLKGQYDPGNNELIRNLSRFWADETLVEIQGVISRKPDGEPNRIDIQFIEKAPQEKN